MTTWYPADIPIVSLQEAWTGQGPDAALALARQICRERGEDAWSRLLLGRVGLAAGWTPDAVAPLLDAARDPATRPYAVISLAGCAPHAVLPEVLAHVASLPPRWAGCDEIRYARGLALWRLGERASALEVWEETAAPDAPERAEALDRARAAHAQALLDEDKLGESLLVLQRISDPARPEALPLRRSLAVAAARSGQIELAREAARGLGGGAAPVDRVLWSLLVPVGAARVEAVGRLLEDRHVPRDLAVAASCAAAAALALDGRCDEAGELLPADPASDEGRTLGVLLRFASSGGRALPGVADCDWRHLRGATAEVDGLIDQLAAAPEGEEPRAVAGYWLARGDAAKAYEALATAQRSDPWNATIVRHLALLGYLRAAGARPSVDVEAWRDCIAQTVCLVENRRWLGAWVLSRFGTYDIKEEEEKRREDLRDDLYQFLDQRLTTLAAGARERDDRDAADAVGRLKAEFAWERRAAAAMWEVGDVRSADGRRLAFGPLFADRAGQRELVAEFFAAQPEREIPSPSEALRNLLASLGLDAARAAGVLGEDTKDATKELRRWYSELGEAAALQAAGRAREARTSALAVYVRWSPPGLPSAEEFARANLGYAHLRKRVARLRADAAAMFCDMSIAAFREELSSAGFDSGQIVRRVREILGEAIVLGHESEARYQLTKLMVGKQNSLLRSDDLDSAQQAWKLMAGAAEAGLSGLEQPLTRAAHRYADLLRQHQRLRAGADCYEEVWRIHKSEPVVASNLVALLLEHYTRLRNDQRFDEAEAVIGRAREVAEEASGLFPNNTHARALPELVGAVRRGIPLGELVEMRRSGPETQPVVEPAMAEEAKAAIDRCREADGLGDVPAARAAAEEARSAAPDHPDVVALAARAALELARTVSETEGRALFEHAERILQPAGARYPGNASLALARSELERDRILYQGDTPLARLHRKALLLSSDGKPGAAVELLKVVFTLAPERDAEVCALLAQAMVAHAEMLRGSDPSRAEDVLRTAEKVLAVGREIAPAHVGMENTRERLALARERPR